MHRALLPHIDLAASAALAQALQAGGHDVVLADNTTEDITLAPIIEQPVQPPMRRRPPGMATALAIAAALGAHMPPRDTGRTIIGKKLSDPLRIAAAMDKRARKRAKRLRDQA